ncbi:MAG TPA: HEAT repeat domain-containing protein, partial [Candidatus Baltobacteraceae bacterium]|nr:HEAT repeat domain-containing protein [Candidatus Baltobacteraceae bacterium]
EFRQAVAILAVKPKVIEERGIKAFLADHPVNRVRVLPAKKQEKGDTVLGMDSESYFLAEDFLTSPGLSGATGLESLLQFAKDSGGGSGGGEGLFLPKGREILEIATKVTDAVGGDQTVDPQAAIAQFAQLLEEVTPERFISALPPARQAELRGRSAADVVSDVASDVAEDIAVKVMLKKVTEAPGGPTSAEAQQSAMRVVRLGLSMTRTVDRFMTKLESVLKEANLPPELYERITAEVNWRSSPIEDKRQWLLERTAYDTEGFRHLLEYLEDCLREGRADEAIRVATHYFEFLRLDSQAVQAELPRVVAVLRILADPQVVSLFTGTLDRLGADLLNDERTRECHVQLLVCLTAAAELPTEGEDWQLMYRVGAAIARSNRRNSSQHADCCGRALEQLLPAQAVQGLIDRYLDVRGDAGLARRQVEIMRWAPSVSGEAAFARLVEEQVRATRMRLLRLLAELGPGAIEAARKRLTDERWYVVRNACCVLGEAGDPDAPKDLRAALRHNDVRVQQAAVAALARSEAPGATATMAEILPGLQAQVVEQALDELLFRKDPTTIGALGRFIHLGKGGKPGILEKAVRALAGIPSEQSVRVLGVVLWDSGHATIVRRAAAAALLQIPQPVARRFVEEFARRMPEHPISQAITQSLTRTPPPTAPPKA